VGPHDHSCDQLAVMDALNFETLAENYSDRMLLSCCAYACMHVFGRVERRINTSQKTLKGLYLRKTLLRKRIRRFDIVLGKGEVSKRERMVDRRPFRTHCGKLNRNALSREREVEVGKMRVTMTRIRILTKSIEKARANFMFSVKRSLPSEENGTAKIHPSIETIHSIWSKIET